MTSVLAASAAAVLVMMLALWVVSLLLVNASIVDLFWGLGFVLIAWVAVWVVPDVPARGYLAAWLVTSWGVRLATHLTIRNVGHGEDYRYRAMRAHHGARFSLVSLGTVFLLQGVLMWIVSLPVQAAVGLGAQPIGWLDRVAIGLVVMGIVFETVADGQLARFKRDAANAGQVMDRGLWRYSRHPNYFGDCVAWWGFGTLGVAAGAPWSLVGPALMTVLLLKVSGVALLESTITERRPAYRDYIARTSAFVPWPPTRGPLREQG